MPFVVGETIGAYRILEQLGRGGMATVFKAYHAALDRYVAIKALHPAFMEDPNFHTRFQREARVVAKLEHPNIVPIYDFAEYESRPYLVMKFIEGQTLKARLTDGTIDQAEFIQIVEAVGASLSYAHQKGILHRDVKPSNVLLGYDGRVYLADFGLARIAQAGESTLSSDMMLGTPQYISPEQAMGIGELDERTDIYSFGVMLYEMTVGKVPFSADTPFSIIHDHIYTPLPLPRTVNPEVSEPVERVLLKALAKERDDRYPGAKELTSALESAIRTKPESLLGKIPLTLNGTQVLDPIDQTESVMTPGTVGEFDTEMNSTAFLVQASERVTQVKPVFKDTLDGQEEGNVSQAKPSRRFRWWYILIGFFLIISCCVCSLVGYDTLIGFPNLEYPFAELFPQDPPPEPFSDQDLQFDGRIEEIPLSEAQVGVEEVPEDPNAWLDLAAAYRRAGQIEEAWGALNRALEIAGYNPDFIYSAAEEFSAAGYWVEAAHLYLEGILRFDRDGAPEEIIDGFSEAVYWAAEYPMADKDISISMIEEIDPPLERVVKARYEYYQGDPGEAERILEEVLININPGMPEAMLLQAEIFFSWGEDEQAVNILLDLLERDDIPNWMQSYLEFMVEGEFDRLDEIQRLVAQNPDDPWLQMELYAALLSLGMHAEAEGAIEQAIRLGGDDPEVPNVGGDIAAAHGSWLRAAQLYAHSVKLSQVEAPPEVAEKIIKTLYYGAAEEGAPEVFAMLEQSLPDDGKGTLRPNLQDTLIARYKLYYEDAGEAEIIVNDVLRRAPNLPLARLVQAEVFLILGDLDHSQEVLQELSKDQDLAPWMHEEIEFMLAYINPDL